MADSLSMTSFTSSVSLTLSTPRQTKTAVEDDDLLVLFTKVARRMMAARRNVATAKPSTRDVMLNKLSSSEPPGPSFVSRWVGPSKVLTTSSTLTLLPLRLCHQRMIKYRVPEANPSTLTTPSNPLDIVLLTILSS